MRDRVNRKAWRLTSTFFFHFFLVYRYAFLLKSPGQITDPRAIIGDTKAGTLIGTDRFGNKYYENMEEELPRKTAREM